MKETGEDVACSREWQANIFRFAVVAGSLRRIYRSLYLLIVKELV